jgi:hypothetical protein
MNVNKDELTTRLTSDLDALRKLAQDSPQVWKNKVMIVEAEKAAFVDKQGWTAVQIYQEAVLETERQRLTHDLALVNELQAKFLLSLSAVSFAKASMKQAYRAYVKVGWQRKADQLLTLYPDLLHINTGTHFKIHDYRHANVTSDLARITNTVNVTNIRIDLGSILKSSRLLSSAIDMDYLLEIIIKIIVETAGGTHASIIVDGVVKAEYINQEPRLCNLPLHEWEGCTAVIEHVTSMEDILVTGCAHLDNRYEFMKTDNYIQTNKSKSSMISSYNLTI